MASQMVHFVLDHARIQLENPRVWLPLTIGIFGVITTVMMGIIQRPSRGDILIFTVSMVLLVAVGLLGFMFHVQSNILPRGVVVVERFLRGSPLFAPLVFSNVGLLGLLVLLDPAERQEME